MIYTRIFIILFISVVIFFFGKLAYKNYLLWRRDKIDEKLEKYIDIYEERFGNAEDNTND